MKTFRSEATDLDRIAGEPPTDLFGAMQELMFTKDKGTSIGGLVSKLVSYSSSTVEVNELHQTRLSFLQTDGTAHHYRLHPQGMEVDLETGLLYITVVEIIEPRDAAQLPCGRGRAHLFECDIQGNTLRSAVLKSDHEEEYHPSGMVLVDNTMFIALAQYLPETSATIIRFDLNNWRYENLFRIQDHVGLVVPNLDSEELLLGTWGSKEYYRTDLVGKIKSRHRTPCFDTMEHQDAQFIGAVSTSCVGDKQLEADTSKPNKSGTPMMLATGVTAEGKEYFGLDLINMEDWSITASLRWPSAQNLTASGCAPFANPTYLWVDSYDRVLALATPDDCHEQAGKDSRLLLYELIPAPPQG